MTEFPNWLTTRTTHYSGLHFALYCSLDSLSSQLLSKNLFCNILIILGGNRTFQLRYNITIINPFKTPPSSLTIIPTQPYIPIFAPGRGRCVPPSHANAFYHFAHPIQGFEDLSHRQTLLVSYFGQLTRCHLWWLISLSIVLSRAIHEEACILFLLLVKQYFSAWISSILGIPFGLSK